MLYEVQTPEKEFIGEGRFRRVYEVNSYVVKELKSSITKRTPFGFKVSLPTSTYTKYKYGIEDFNEFEFDKYLEFRKMTPFLFRDNFAHLYQVVQTQDSSLLMGDLIKNSDGSISQTLKKEPVSDEDFWDRIRGLEEIMLDLKIPFFGLNGSNVLVQRQKNKINPVLVDYKRFSETFPFQLLTPKKIEEKQKRQFRELRERYWIS